MSQPPGLRSGSPRDPRLPLALAVGLASSSQGASTHLSLDTAPRSSHPSHKRFATWPGPEQTAALRSHAFHPLALGRNEGVSQRDLRNSHVFLHHADFGGGGKRALLVWGGLRHGQRDGDGARVPSARGSWPSLLPVSLRLLRGRHTLLPTELRKARWSLLGPPHRCLGGGGERPLPPRT